MYRKIQELKQIFNEIFDSRAQEILKTGDEEILKATKAQTAEFYKYYRKAIDLAYTYGGSAERDLAVRDLETIVQKMRTEAI